MNNEFTAQFEISDMVLHHMLSNEDYKKQIKKQLAHMLAEELLDSNRTTFEYIPNHNLHNTIVRARIKL